MLLEEDIAWEGGLHIGHCFDRQVLGCSRNRLLHLCFAPFLATEGKGDDGIQELEEVRSGLALYLMKRYWYCDNLFLMCENQSSYQVSEEDDTKSIYLTALKRRKEEGGRRLLVWSGLIRIPIQIPDL